jgi:hypothetical protein
MDYKRFYHQLFAPIEQRFGAMDREPRMAVLGFDFGGPVSLCTLGRGRASLVTYVTCELAVRPEQQPSNGGRYEITMTCDDESWARDILTRFGQMSMDTVFDDGHTVDIGPVVKRRCPVQGLVVEEFARVTIDDSRYAIRQLHGVTRPELEFAMRRGAPVLLQRLRKAGIYPQTSTRRMKSIDSAG